MENRIMKRIIAVVALMALFAVSTFGLPADKQQNPKPAHNLSDLEQQIEKILNDTHTPGVSIAIVHRDGPEWVTGLGKADVASGRPASARTLFRIGSTSKAFASMSILLLADQGKVSLDDAVRKLAPEVWFQNRWEATDPVRVVNLLEHTTGWDDLYLRDYAKDEPDTMGVLDGLNYDPHSRTSRWPPGTRMAYCNSGPAVAAYIVEKITGQRFEDFVEQNLFLPIGMKTATYFQSAVGLSTTLYQQDGKTPYPYWHILERPAGAINASANDMAAYLQFYLNRGAINGKQILPASDIARMESPTSTWAAKQGLKAGYGLSNYWVVEDGFVYHGHNGGVSGGLTTLAYMPDYGVGYFFSINSGNGRAFEQIDKAIRAYLTKDLQPTAIPAIAALPSTAQEYAGWYEPDSPRKESLRFLERLAFLTWIRFREGKLILTSLMGNMTFAPVEGMQFRLIPKKGLPDPVATLELLAPNTEGRFVQRDAQTTMKRIPGSLAIVEIAATLFVILSMLAVLVYAPFWILGGLSRKRRRPSERAMRIWPLIAVISLLAVPVITLVSQADIIERLGNLTGWSASIFLATITFAVAVIASAIAWWRTPVDASRRRVRRFSLIVTSALLISLAYLGYWGVIGFRTWS